ncbi:MAG TPA: hypothetical protein DEB39_12250 [Planctomycetaceae bacterium]|nr:hypothetical protein [Planctomycetaceae bacterium]
MVFAAFSPGVRAQAPARSPERPLAPGILTTIPPRVDFNEVTNRNDAVELLASLPEPDPVLKDDIRYLKEVWAKDIRYSRPVWCLQFSFKPLRIVSVDIPNKEGTMDRKLVWYLLYKIENTDVVLGNEVDQVMPFPIIHDATAEDCQCEFCREVQNPDFVENIELQGPLTLRTEEGSYKPTDKLGLTIQCVPQFVLAAERVVVQTRAETDPETGAIESVVDTKPVSYVDRIIPLAMPVVMKREGFKATDIPETTVSIARKSLKPGDSVWGVAMWMDIDPKISKFSIFISGLTNAYRWQDKTLGEAGAYKPGDLLGTGRSMERRVLKLNWWKLGDEFMINDKEIKYGWPGAVDCEWVYR